MNLWPYQGSPTSQHVQHILWLQQQGDLKRDDLYWCLIELVRVAIQDSSGDPLAAGLPPDDLHVPGEKVHDIL